MDRVCLNLISCMYEGYYWIYITARGMLFCISNEIDKS